MLPLRAACVFLLLPLAHLPPLPPDVPPTAVAAARQSATLCPQGILNGGIGGTTLMTLPVIALVASMTVKWRIGITRREQKPVRDAGVETLQSRGGTVRNASRRLRQAPARAQHELDGRHSSH